MTTTATCPAPPGAVPRPRTGRSSPVVAAVVVAVCVGLVVAVPRALHASWAGVGRLLLSVPPAWLVTLTAVWAAGLLVHSLVLTASLPGLTVRRAVSLNLAGSAVGNCVPAGGVVGMVLTARMGASWGFTRGDVRAFLSVSTVWNVGSRVAFGVLGALWWLAAHGRGGTLAGALVPALATVAAVGALAASARLTAAAAGAVGGTADLLRGRRGLAYRGLRRRCAAGALELRALSLAVARRGWRRLAAGSAGYLAAVCVLLDLCLRAVGATPSVTVVVAAVAVERLLTAVPLTPGGAGVAELGLAAVLHLAGVPADAAVAATLLYRVFTFAAEIPAGLAVILGWSWRQRDRPSGRAAPDAPAVAS